MTAIEIPSLLQQHARWVLWAIDGNGRKVPRAVGKPSRNIDASKPTNWSTYKAVLDAVAKDKVAAEPTPHLGIGFALGAVNDGPAFAGVDLDKCRNKDTGVIEDWAMKIITLLDSYTEVSPSGTGVKIFLLGTLPDESRQGKVYKLEIYDRGRYFTVTGNHLVGTPLEIRNSAEALRQLHAAAWSKDLAKLVRLFGFWISDALPDRINIRCPWIAGHSGGNQERDAGLLLQDGKVGGFNCFHASCSERTIGDVNALFGLKGGQQFDFKVDHNGNVIAKNQENIRRALQLLGVKLDHDTFADRKYIITKSGRRVLDDDVLDDIYLTLDDTYKFCPPRDYFDMVVMGEARMTPVHPVLDFLNGLMWDGVSRIDTWISTYGGAEDTPLHRLMSSKTLIAAVRRVRRPGCKFDTMLVLESDQQGLNKSTALATLCPAEWFSDDLPLNVDAKQLIERTAGKWIVESSDLSGMRKSDVEHLKGMLSRGTDGPVRMAYARIPVSRERQWILVGTTNNRAYLKDSTGGRRFWPVKIRRFDIDKLKADRDQLWAEAVRREADGESITLPEEFWDVAAVAQEERRVVDPWEETLLDSDIDWEATHLAASAIWLVLGVSNQNDTRNAERLGPIMQRLGYPMKKQCRYKGQHVTHWIRKDVAVEQFGLEAESARPDFITRGD